MKRMITFGSVYCVFAFLGAGVVLVFNVYLMKSSYHHDGDYHNAAANLMEGSMDGWMGSHFGQDAIFKMQCHLMECLCLGDLAMSPSKE